LFLVCSIHVGHAQDIQVNRQNKTISVTADESITAEAEVAVIAVGYHNYASNREDAFQENIRVSNGITKALLDSGIAKENIETGKLNLSRVEQDEKWTPEMKKDRQFEAQQAWHITLPVARAQAAVNLAVKSGANEVDDVEWNVADPVALQAKASGAALAKARTVAEQMAKGLGTKLGELVYASNRAPVSKFFRSITLNTESATLSSTTEEKKPELTLFPQKVKSDATVYAVFAIE
jgi:uncharacterized protein YggE